MILQRLLPREGEVAMRTALPFMAIRIRWRLRPLLLVLPQVRLEPVVASTGELIGMQL